MSSSPAFNEEHAIGKVIDEIPKGLVRHIIVANNNSTDGTAYEAENHGANVVFELKAGLW